MEFARGYERYIPKQLTNIPQISTATWNWQDFGIHLIRVGDPNAPVRIILVHGAGGNSSAMWPYAAHLAQLGAYVTVPDLPGYGKTEVAKPGKLRYFHWQKFLVDLVKNEADSRPLILMGASMGGMLAYDAAATTGLASALVVTCLLDPREQSVRKHLTWHPLLALIGIPLLKFFAVPFGNLRIPIKWLANMRKIANSPALVNAVISDKTGGGSKVSLGWMSSFMESCPLVEPDDYKGPPVYMLHPAEDKWTPLSISKPFFDRINAKKYITVLDNSGHFPIEEPGFSIMLNEVKRIIDAVQ